MASFLFQNVKTNETKVVNSQDSATAKRVYTNGTWKYVKAVPQQKPASKTTKSSVKSSDMARLWQLSCSLVSSVHGLKDEAEDCGLRFHRPHVSSMEDALIEIQKILRNY